MTALPPTSEALLQDETRETVGGLKKRLRSESGTLAKDVGVAPGPLPRRAAARDAEPLTVYDLREFRDRLSQRLKRIATEH
jgi:hypothetical protein